MFHLPTIVSSQPALTASFRGIPARARAHVARIGIRQILGHAILSVVALLLFLLLNRPEVILLSRLGTTAWYPAAGLVFAVMLVVSPRYMPLFCLGNALAAVLIYHQPVLSWGVAVGAPLGTGVYAVAVMVLRGQLQINFDLRTKRDVLRYVVVTSAGAVLSGLIGAACLRLDESIPQSQFSESALGWLMGDEIALLSIAPVLLIYVLPWVKNQIYGVTSAITIQGDEVKKGSEPAELFLQTLEFAGQAACFLLLFWVMFGAFASNQFYFLAFLPIAWIAMRHGMRGAVIGLFALNFGIVVSLRIWPAPSDIFTKLGFVMLAVSATGLFLGTVVAERLGLANNLKEQTVFLNSLIDNSPFAIVVYDREGNIQHCSEGFTRLFLHARAEILGRNLRALVVPGEQRSEAEHFLAEANEGRTVHGNVRRLRKDGQLVDVELYILPTILDGHVQGASVVYMDISERVRAAEAAKEHEETTNRWVSELQERTMQITLLNEMSSLLQCSEDSEEAYRVVAQSARKLFGSARAGALFLLNPTHNSLERKAAWGEITAQKLEFGASDCWSLRKGHLHWSEAPGNSIVCAHTDASLAANYLCVPMVANGETLGVLHLQYDPAGANVDAETELKSRTELERLAVAAGAQVALSLTNLHLRETLREQSIRDPLTGLFNRRFMQEFLERELLASKRKGRPLAIVFVDLDHFKHFNDVFGHDAGDTVLQSMASAFRLLFRGEDVICRYGGEEFAIILPECPIQDAVKRAEALRVAVKEINLAHQGKRLDSVTLSIGVAAYPEHGEGVQELLDRADKCLYQSKANGRDCVTAASV